MIKKYSPSINIPAGEFIREELLFRKLKQDDLADILGVALKTVNQIISGAQGHTVQMAKKLSIAFGQSPDYWLSIYHNYLLRKEKVINESSIKEKAYIYQKMPVREMMKRGWVKKTKKEDKLLKEVIKFWNIRSLNLEFIKSFSFPCFRKSESFKNFNHFNAAAWFQRARNISKRISAPNFNKKKLTDLLNNLSVETFNENNIPYFINKLHSTGVKFFILKHLDKTYIDGASFLDGNSPVIVYTVRFDRTDNFWFTICHEMAHVLKHLNQKDKYFVDCTENYEGRESIKEEREADEIANNALKKGIILNKFKNYGKYIYRSYIQECAQELQIHPSIIVGLLQYDGLLKKTHLNGFKGKVSGFIQRKLFFE